MTSSSNYNAQTPQITIIRSISVPSETLSTLTPTSAPPSPLGYSEDVNDRYNVKRDFRDTNHNVSNPRS